MNILIATNSNYLLPTMTMLYSLLVHTKEDIIVYVLHSTLKKEEKDKLDKMLMDSGHARSEYIEISEKEFEGYHTEKWISIETYYRLLAQKLLPKSVERILWLDGDTIVLDDLSDFYHMNLEGKLIAACEFGYDIKDNKDNICKSFLLPNDARPFNAGVILFDMSAIREQIDPDIYMQYVQYLGKHLIFADQDVLNAVFYNQVYYLDPRVYNCTRIFEPVEILRKIANIKNVKILHYNGGSKPWNTNYYGLYAYLFWRYAKHIEGWKADYEDVKDLQIKRRRIFLRKNKARWEKEVMLYD